MAKATITTMEDTATPVARMISVAAAARRLGVTESTMRALLGAEVRAIRVGRVFRVDEASLDAYIERQTVRPTP
jgi:excisionase family DNA binding protein